MQIISFFTCPAFCSAPDGQVITSQLFFPGVTQNDEDGIYNASLLLAITQTSDGLQGQYNFVVPAS